MTFSHPPHPSVELLTRSSSSSSSSSPLKLSVKATSSLHSNDPHQLPTFDANSLTHPRSPVLYLPPLLSSLPERFPALPLSSENPPLVTETRLPDIDPASLSLHKALHGFKPLHSDYAGTPYAEAFNWSQLTLPEDEEREWYCVVFRSKRKAGSDGGRECILSQLAIFSSSPVHIALYDADKKAHEEAVRNGGVSVLFAAISVSHISLCLAHTILVRHPESGNGHEPCNLYLAKSETCNRSQFASSSYSGYAVSG